MAKQHLRARERAFTSFILAIDPGGLHLTAPEEVMNATLQGDPFYVLSWEVSAPPSAELLQSFESALFSLDVLMTRWSKLRTALYETSIELTYSPLGVEASLQLLRTEGLNILRRLLGFSSLHALIPTLPFEELLKYARVPLPPVPTAVTRNKDLELRATYAEDLAFYFLLGVSRSNFLFDWSTEGDDSYTLEQFRFTRNLLQFIAGDGDSTFKEFLRNTPPDVAIPAGLLQMHSVRSHRQLLKEPRLLELKSQELRSLLNSLFSCQDELLPWLIERLLAVRARGDAIDFGSRYKHIRNKADRGPVLLEAVEYFLTPTEQREFSEAFCNHRLNERVAIINPGLYALFSFAWLSSSPTRFEEFVLYMLQHWGRAQKDGTIAIRSYAKDNEKRERLALIASLTDVAEAPLTHIMLFNRAKFEEVSHEPL